MSTKLTLTIVSPIPRLKIPANGARGRSLNPDDIQIGNAQPNSSEKWLKKVKKLLIKTCSCQTCMLWFSNEGYNMAYLTIRRSESR